MERARRQPQWMSTPVLGRKGAEVAAFCTESSFKEGCLSISLITISWEDSFCSVQYFLSLKNHLKLRTTVIWQYTHIYECKLKINLVKNFLARRFVTWKHGNYNYTYFSKGKVLINSLYFSIFALLSLIMPRNSYQSTSICS